MLSQSTDGRKLLLPALATAHSHAFQRAMRGAAQRSSGASRADFWSWRSAMYRAAAAMTPETLAAVSRVAFRELHRAGVRTVGEFHYLHHQVDGAPYEERTLTSDIVIAAAKAEGLRICLLRVAYHRAGPGREAEPDQRRFCDPRVEDVIRDTESLLAKYKDDPWVRIGIAPHSVRALPPDWIREIAAWANSKSVPLHMHVAEQPREVAECIAETGSRPMDLLDDLGALSPRFVAVHATHLAPREAERLGSARAFACVCPTTEADLGDGLPDLVALRAAGARLCTGIDSHVITDSIQELRGLETLARLRTGSRVTFEGSDLETPAEALWRSGSIEGAAACGFEDAGGTVSIDRDHPTLGLVEEPFLLDAIVFGGSSSMLDVEGR